MSSISSSASSKSIILMATTFCVLLSMLYTAQHVSLAGHTHTQEVTHPLKTSPKLPFPIFSSLVKSTSGSLQESLGGLVAYVKKEFHSPAINRMLIETSGYIQLNTTAQNDSLYNQGQHRSQYTHSAEPVTEQYSIDARLLVR